MTKQKTILWITNVPPINFESLSQNSHFGGWLQNQFLSIKEKDFKLGVFFPGPDSIEFCEDNVLVKQTKLIPYFDFINTKTIRDELYSLIKKLKPDVIHIHGSETLLSHIAANVALEFKIPYILSIQGLIHEYSNHIFTGVIDKKLSRPSLRDIFFKSSLKGLKSNITETLSQREKFILFNAHKIFGRTEWDMAAVRFLNLECKYEQLFEPIRDSFWDEEKWSSNHFIPGQIYINQSYSPYKGFHIFLDALEYLNNLNISLSIRISGKDYFSRPSIFQTGYEKQLVKKMKSLKNFQFKFLGNLNSQEVAAELRECNIFVMPSVIENSPAAIAEAIVIQTPIISSFVGGIPSLYGSFKNITLYQSDSSLMLANKIFELLDRKSQINNSEVNYPKYDADYFYLKLSKAYEIE